MSDLSYLKNRVFPLPNKLLTLKVLTPKDVSDEYVSWLNDYEGVRFTDQKSVEHNKEGVADFVNDKLNSNVDLLFGIFFDTRHIGNIKLGPIDYIHKVSDISFFIGDKEMWGKGLMTQVIDFVVDLAFKEVGGGLDKVTAGAYANNIGSIKTLEKTDLLQRGGELNKLFLKGSV